MPDPDNARLLAEYNRWMNRKLYAVCAELDDAALYEDRGAFFGSIFATLNHIMYGDLAFLSRFTGDPATVPELGRLLETAFTPLRIRREELDERLIAWTRGLDARWLAESLTYSSKVDGITRTVPHWALVTHMFNHQTHHRGQITTLLSQLGKDVGSTDIPFMPRFAAD